MGMFDSSIDLERSILKILMSDIVGCRMYVFRLKESYFSSEARRFIFSAISREFSLSQNLLPEKVLEYEITSKHDRQKLTYLGEMNFVQNSIASPNMEASIRSLHDVAIGRETLTCMEGVNALLGEGRYMEAATEFRQKAFTINTVEDSKQTVEVFSDMPKRMQKIRDKRDNPEKYRGLRTGFKTFDAKTGGLFKGEMTLLAGVTGLGKSTILKQMEFGVLLNNKGKNILHIANEEYEDQVTFKFDSVITGRDYLDYKFAEKDVMTEEIIQKWEKELQHIQETSGGRLYVREVPAFSDVSVIRRVFYELKSQGINIDVIFIDHLPNMKPIQKAFGENNEREKCASEVKELARELSVPVVIPTQAATQVEEKQMKGKRANKLDVYGSKAQIHHANTFFIITFLGRDNKTRRVDGSPETLEYLKDALILLDVKKNRDGPCFTLKLKHQVRNGRMDEIDIDPEILKKIEKEHAEALKTGDYSTTVTSDDMEVVKAEKPAITTTKQLETQEIIDSARTYIDGPEDETKTETIEAVELALPETTEKPKKKGIFDKTVK